MHLVHVQDVRANCITIRNVSAALFFILFDVLRVPYKCIGCSGNLFIDCDITIFILVGYDGVYDICSNVRLTAVNDNKITGTLDPLCSISVFGANLNNVKYFIPDMVY